MIRTALLFPLYCRFRILRKLYRRENEVLCRIPAEKRAHKGAPTYHDEADHLAYYFSVGCAGFGTTIWNSPPCGLS